MTWRNGGNPKSSRRQTIRSAPGTPSRGRTFGCATVSSVMAVPPSGQARHLTEPNPYGIALPLPDTAYSVMKILKFNLGHGFSAISAGALQGRLGGIMSQSGQLLSGGVITLSRNTHDLSLKGMTNRPSV